MAGAFLMPIFRKDGDLNGIFEWSVPVEGRPEEPHQRQRLQLFHGRKHHSDG